MLESVDGLGTSAGVLVQVQNGDGAQRPADHLVEKGGLDLLLVEGAANGGRRVLLGLRHSRSSPARMAGVPLWVAPKSDMTRPQKPRSCLRICSINPGFSQA